MQHIWPCYIVGHGLSKIFFFFFERLRPSRHILIIYRSLRVFINELIKDNSHFISLIVFNVLLIRNISFEHMFLQLMHLRWFYKKSQNIHFQETKQSSSMENVQVTSIKIYIRLTNMGPPLTYIRKNINTSLSSPLPMYLSGTFEQRKFIAVINFYILCFNFFIMFQHFYSSMEYCN